MDKSGKTQFSRGKKPGDSWTERRAEAIKDGRFPALPDRYAQKKAKKA